MVVKLHPRELEQAEALLTAEGISLDKHLDYTCGIFDDEHRLIATGSAFVNTLRCFAVAEDHQGEGLLNEIVSHLISYEMDRGLLHLFLYTKPESAKFFGDLGFHEIARVEGRLVFMENRRNGFAQYLSRLSKEKTAGKSTAIVMNANPFTLGHRFLVETAAGENERVHLFVLSEDHGPIPASVRLRLVREGVADLKNVVVHETGPYLISKATFPGYFLKTEDAVLEAQARLDTALFARIAAALGVTSRYLGEEPTSVVTGIYNRVLTQELPKLGIRCRIIPRKEAGGQAISASTVRQALHDGRLEEVRNALPPTTLAFFQSQEALPVLRAIQSETDVIHH